MDGTKCPECGAQAVVWKDDHHEKGDDGRTRVTRYSECMSCHAAFSEDVTFSSSGGGKF